MIALPLARTPVLLVVPVLLVPVLVLPELEPVFPVFPVLPVLEPVLVLGLFLPSSYVSPLEFPVLVAGVYFIIR